MDSVSKRSISDAAFRATALSMKCPVCTEEPYIYRLPDVAQTKVVHDGPIGSMSIVHISDLELANTEPFVLFEWFEDWCAEHHRQLEEREAFSAALDKAGWKTL